MTTICLPNDNFVQIHQDASSDAEDVSFTFAERRRVTAAIIRRVPEGEWNEAIPILGMPPWQIEALQRIEKLGQLKRNWDGYNSPPIPADVRQRAFKLLISIISNRLGSPGIFPEAGGALQIEWELADKALELHLQPNGVVRFLLVEGDEEREGIIESDNFKSLKELFSRLIAG